MSAEVEWPQPGDFGRVECSDSVWRTAFCIDRMGIHEWVFADNNRRRVDVSTAHSLVSDRQIAKAKRDAWEEGFDAGERDVMEHEGMGWRDDHPCIPNPYRADQTGGVA